MHSGKPQFIIIIQRISWISPFLQPRTSVISMVRLDLSRSLERWMMISSAEEICWRIAGSGRPAFPCSTMVSRRLSISLVELAWPVERLPSWPVFIACSISSASAPRTSPTMILSGRIRSADLIRSRMVTSPFPEVLAFLVSRLTILSIFAI